MYSTNYFGTKVMNTFRGTTASAATALYCALLMADPGPNGAGVVEANYVGYARQAISFSAPYQDNTISGGVMAVKSGADLVWETTPSDAGTVTHIAIYDSAVVGSGNMWLFADLAVPLPLLANRKPSLSAGDILYYAEGDFTKAFQTKLLNLLRGSSIAGFVP
jgi:hypothetical protein